MICSNPIGLRISGPGSHVTCSLQLQILGRFKGLAVDACVRQYADRQAVRSTRRVQASIDPAAGRLPLQIAIQMALSVSKSHQPLTRQPLCAEEQGDILAGVDSSPQSGLYGKPSQPIRAISWTPRVPWVGRWPVCCCQSVQIPGKQQIRRSPVYTVEERIHLIETL